MKNFLIAQSGGPTAAINSTVAGIMERCYISGCVGKIYGAKHGIEGVLADELIELTPELFSPVNLALLCQTPGAALGSCRKKLRAQEEYDKIIEVFQKHDIHYFVYIGGNDSMDTVAKLTQMVKERNLDINVIGAPKTIDNDLYGTDHCPGFGSAAKYIAATFAEMGKDCDSYKIPAVILVEVMGRNAGWLTGSSALARINGGKSPDLIYVCERPFDINRFLEQVRQKLSEKPEVVVALSEGLKNKDGAYVSESAQHGIVDEFGHKYLTGTATYLKGVVESQIGCKVRAIELSLMQRCAGHVASATDLTESRLLGNAAADRALTGGTGEMAAIKRLPGKDYRIAISYESIEKIANLEKKIPDSWITPEGCDVTQEFVDYVLPLIQGEAPIAYQNGVPLHLTLF